MSLTLAIETSSIDYGVALFTDQQVVAHQTVRRDAPSFQGIGHLVSSLLDSAGRQFQDLERVAVNIGPGNLGSVRAGVAYANGLAFSLQIKIFCANSLNLLALEVAESSEQKVLCLRNAGGGNVYAGLFRGGEVLGLRHGPMESVVTSLAGGLPEVSVAGTFRREVKGMLPDACIKDTGIEFPHVLTLHRMMTAAGRGRANLVDVASPLTDSSPVFHG